MEVFQHISRGQFEARSSKLHMLKDDLCRTRLFVSDTRRGCLQASSPLSCNGQLLVCPCVHSFLRMVPHNMKLRFKAGKIILHFICVAPDVPHHWCHRDYEAIIV